MSFRDRIVDLASATERNVTEATVRLNAGRADVGWWTATVAGIVSAANRRGIELADLSLVAFLALAGREVLPLGLDVDDREPDRLTRALATLNARAVDGDDRLRRAARLARAEPMDAARAALTQAMDRRTEVAGWTRQTGGSACELCASLADGTVLPADAPMADHPGCDCTQQPVLNR